MNHANSYFVLKISVKESREVTGFFWYEKTTGDQYNLCRVPYSW